MYALWVMGSYLEPMLGRARFVAIYLLSALGGSVMYLLLSTPPSAAQIATGDYGMWWTGAVGASGAVFGLFGAFLVLQRRLGRSSAGMYVIIGINAVIGFVIPGIAWQAHLGGLLTGAGVAAAIAYSGRNRGPLAAAGEPAGALGLDGRHPAGARRADDREVRPGRLSDRACGLHGCHSSPVGTTPVDNLAGWRPVSASGWSSGSRRASGRSRRRGSSGPGPAPGTGPSRRCSR